MSRQCAQWRRVIKEPALREAYIRKVREVDGAIHSFLSFEIKDPPESAYLDGLSAEGLSSENLQSEGLSAEGLLRGVPLAVKDNIAVEGRPLTCASRILENFVSPYTATSVRKLERAGAVVVGKTNMDEFGMGSSTTNSAFGKTCNPWDASRVAGGSSGGSAAAVAAGLVPLALGSDTGGSVRQPASFCGVYGLKPTYGVISRYGLTAYASSLDVIGGMSLNLQLLREAFHVMAGLDGQDQSSVSVSPGFSRPSGQQGPAAARRAGKKAGKKAVMLKVDKGVLDPEVAGAYTRAADFLRSSGYTVEAVSLPSLHLVVPAYYTIATAEASANLARYNGMRYGHAPVHAENPAELMRSARQEGFGDEVKLRILLGTYVLRSGFQEQYYGRARKVRTLICREFNALFNDAALMLMPVFPVQAFVAGASDMDEYRQKLADVFTSLANLTGTPALSVPMGVSGGLPVGIQLLAPAFGEERLFEAGALLAGCYSPERAPCSLDVGSLTV